MAPMQVLGYVRVSTEEQAEEGVGLDAQREAITAEAERRGWDLIATVEDRGYSAKNLKRPGIQTALAELKGGEANALVTAKVDRLSRSTLDFASLIERAQREGWEIVTLDFEVDMSSPMGEAMAGMSAVFAQLERRLIGQRTRRALQKSADRASGSGALASYPPRWSTASSASVRLAPLWKRSPRV